MRSNRKWCKRRGSSLECQNCFFVYPIIDSNLKKFPQIIFEETWAPKEFELEIILEEGDIGISNGCLRPRSDMITCFVEGCAMIKEELGEDKFRFYCNDIDWDDDFDDLIFDLEIEKVAYEE
ncbi:hypothetical protein ACR74R_13075 [Mediterraneibacter gnavus]|uniref:hypothetical protein n=1 Tax=Mediterraneibacter gnavus TaxID=33038 RepID=UPI003DA344DE